MGDRACAATCVLVCLARARPLPAQLSLLCCAHFTGLEAGTLGCRTSFWGWESRQGWLAQGSYQGGDAQRLLCPGAWDQPGRAVLPTIFLPLSPPLAVTPLPLTAPQLEHDPSSRAFSSQTLALFQEAFQGCLALVSVVGASRASCELSLGDRETGELGAGVGSQEREAQGTPMHPWALCVLPAPVATPPGSCPALPGVRGALGLGQNLRRERWGISEQGRAGGQHLTARSYDWSLSEAGQQDFGPRLAALQGLLGPPHLGNRPEGTWGAQGRRQGT